MAEPQRSRGRGVSTAMLFLGFLAIAIGTRVLYDWADFGAGTRVYYALSLLAGAVLMACGGMALVSAALRVGAMWTGFAAALVLGVNQALGLLLNTLLCFTPG